MDDKATHVVGLSPLTVAIIAVICAAIVLLTYHCIIARWCHQQPPISRHQQHPQLPVTNYEDTPSSLENSIAELIPSYKYNKDIGLVSKTQDGGTCSVCLCEFTDGEAVRVLPECLHPFHVSCIDMWLASHSNCPLCRAGTPTPPRRLAFGRGSSAESLRVPAPMDAA